MEKLIINLSIYIVITALVLVSESKGWMVAECMGMFLAWGLIVLWVNSLFDKTNFVNSPVTHHIVASVGVYLMSGTMLSLGWVLTGVVMALVRSFISGVVYQKKQS